MKSPAYLILITLMALTRIHHFGDSISLPDASLAVFFLAGFIKAKRSFFVLLLALAGLLDYIAIHQFAVSDWCISPAYVFLIPTYGVLWLAGQYAADFYSANLITTGRLFITALFASSIAFIISNISFYLFSGRYEAMSLIDYSSAIMQYYLPYIGSAMSYLIISLIIMKLYASLQAIKLKNYVH